ncbi:hypothetical protein BC937DRAFT_89221 [Endogone sp. FLAS-F59071]|nr:hypothetical protein BC937DRAFT_89221 [Endogone sp. FLAS-F59071]|eukprot:RUS18019.1 hypothetical protein BC937DRAFT_89221 [Endogone sp. FLAS-F59071]
MGDASVGTIQYQADTRGLKRARTEPIRLCQNIFDVQRRDLLGVLTTLRSVFFADDLELDNVVEEEIEGTNKRGKIVDGDGVVIGNGLKIDPPAQPLPASRAQTPPPTPLFPATANTAPRTPPNTNTSPAFTASGFTLTPSKKIAASTIRPLVPSSPVPKVTAPKRESKVPAAKTVSAQASGGTSTTARMDTGHKSASASQSVTGLLTQPAVKAKFATAKAVQSPPVPAPALQLPIIQQPPSTPFESLFSLKSALTIEAKKLPPRT